jgi:hypothetical protein
MSTETSLTFALFSAGMSSSEKSWLTNMVFSRLLGVRMRW